LRRRQSLAQGNANGHGKIDRRASGASYYSEITTEFAGGGSFNDEDEISPSVTPDSSYNGEDLSVDDEFLLQDESQDGMIMSSKPFSNVVSSSQLQTAAPKLVTREAPEVDQLGYGMDNEGKRGGEKLRRELGYEKQASSSHQAADTKDGSTPNLAAKASMRFQHHLSGKKALPNPMARRNLSMSDYTEDDNFGLVKPHDKAKFQRRFSTSVMQQPSGSGKKFKYRLGILRAVDLSGEAIETYSRGGSIAGGASVASGNAPSVKSGMGGSVAEEVDELKVTLIMETIMLACDVAHNLQSWDHMVIWSNRLYLELIRAHKDGRGPDPMNNWHPNQIGFLESYLLPLARRLEDMGVFGDVIGPVFARIVEANRDQWLTDGLAVTNNIIAEGAKKFSVKRDK